MRTAGGLGVGGIVIALLAYFLGFDPGMVTQMAGQAAPGGGEQQAPAGAPSDEAGQFVAKVLGSTEEVWTGVFQQSNARYRPPTLVLYEGQVRSACGMGQAAMGPFYCPADERIYIDLGFYEVMKTRLGAPGDFAQAYVIAHEIGHHVQTITAEGARLVDAACAPSTWRAAIWSGRRSFRLPPSRRRSAKRPTRPR